MSIKNLKIGQRLALSFGSVVLILIVVSVIAYSRIGRLDAAITLTNEDRYPKTVLVHTIKDELNETTRNMRSVLLMSDGNDIKAELDIMLKNAAVIDKSIEQLDTLIKSEQGRIYLKSVTEARNKFALEKDRFVKLATSGMKTEAVALLFTELRPLHLAYFDSLDKLIDYQAA